MGARTLPVLLEIIPMKVNSPRNASTPPVISSLRSGESGFGFHLMKSNSAPDFRLARVWRVEWVVLRVVGMGYL